MKIHSNIPDFINKLQRLKAAVAGGNGDNPPVDISDAMLGAINAGMGVMKVRIFNQGRDANGESLGKYSGGKTNLTKNKFSKQKYSIFGISVRLDEDEEKQRRKQRKNVKGSVGEALTEYEKLRLSLGRQIEYKDLQFSDSLFNSIQCVKDNQGRVVVSVVNTEDAKKVKWQEQQIGNIRAGQPANTGTATPVPIFVFSKEEFDEVKIQGNLAISQIIKEKFEEL